MPDVSLCIPVYRSAAFLPELFARLRALEPKPVEILLLDDASPDGSGEIISSFVADVGPQLNVRLIKNQTNTGIAAAYNRLTREARGQWVHILDADDYPVELNFYARVARHLQDEFDVVVTALHSNSRVLRWGVSMLGGLVPRRPPRWLPLLGSFATRAGVIYRRARLLSRPFFEPAFPGSDILHLVQLRTSRNCVFVREAHVFYRVHTTATSSNTRSYDRYRAGLAQLDALTYIAHIIDLKCRMLGQYIDRR